MPAPHWLQLKCETRQAHPESEQDRGRIKSTAQNETTRRIAINSVTYHFIELTPVEGLPTAAMDALDDSFHSQDTNEYVEFRTFGPDDLHEDEWSLEAEPLRRALAERMRESGEDSVTIIRTHYYD